MTGGKSSDKTNCLKEGFPQERMTPGQLSNSSVSSESRMREFHKEHTMWRESNSSSLNKATSIFSHLLLSPELLSILIPFFFLLIDKKGQQGKSRLFNIFLDYTSQSLDQMKKTVSSISLLQLSVASILYIQMFHEKKTDLTQMHFLIM